MSFGSSALKRTCLSDGLVFEAEFWKDQVNVYDLHGTFLRSWGEVHNPWALGVSAHGEVHVAVAMEKSESTESGRVFRTFSPDGSLLRQWNRDSYCELVIVPSEKGLVI